MTWETYETSWLRVLLLAVFRLISCAAVLIAIAVMVEMLRSPGDKIQEMTIFLAASLAPFVLWFFYRLALWRALGRCFNSSCPVVLFGLFVFVMFGLFPPWLYTFAYPGGHSERDAGYRFILRPPAPANTSPVHGVRLDVARLGTEWLSIVAATGAIWILATQIGGRSDKPS